VGQRVDTGRFIICIALSGSDCPTFCRTLRWADALERKKAEASRVLFPCQKAGPVLKPWRPIGHFSKE